MEKQEFEFYQDVKVSTWVRQRFTIEAESKEEALKMVEQFKTEDIDMTEHSHLIWDIEWMTDAYENMSVEDNHGGSTIELYDRQTKELIGCNGNYN